MIDCFASDHAPHTLQEKNGPNPPPGFPGLETALPLLLGAVHAGRLTLDDLISRLHTNPRRIFSLPEQPETWIEVDSDERWQFSASQGLLSLRLEPIRRSPTARAGERVVLRGRDAYQDGQVVAPPGYGKNLRQND